MYIYLHIYTHMITQSALVSEWNSVVVASNPNHTNFL